MKKLLAYVVNLIFAVAFYYGYFQGFQPARNVFLFFCWFTVLFSFAALSPNVLKEMAKTERSTNIWFSVILDISITVGLAWNGSFVVASFWLLSVILQESGWKRINEMKLQIEQEEQAAARTDI